MRYVLLLLLLSACAASGPHYYEMDKSGVSASAKTSKILIYRTDQLPNFSTSYWIEVNGEQRCDLHNASFAVIDVEPGYNTITTSRFGIVGTSRIELSTRLGEVSYVRFDQKTGRAMLGVLGGVLAGAISESAETQPGPVYLAKVSKQSAMSEMGSYNYESACR